MKIIDVKLDTVCGYTSTLPVFEEPEIAFAGRSNVGKSSLINVLMKRKRSKEAARKAQAKAKPIIPVMRKSFFLVDLPGYGYANVSEDEKMRWGQMIEKYLNSSSGLKLVFLLVDIRHEPNANDIQMYDWVTQSGFTPVIIATKADKLSKGQAVRQMAQVRKALRAPEETAVIAFSALTGEGSQEIYRVIESAL